MNLTKIVKVETVCWDMGDEEKKVLTHEDMMARFKADGFPAHLIKGNHFRVIHVDGAWGGVTPSLNNIQMVIFNHRTPIPQLLVHEVSDDGIVGKESKAVGRPGIVREMEAALVFDLKTAKSIRAWLDDKIADLEKKSKLQDDHLRV